MGLIASLVGAFFVGTALNLVLFGTTFMQSVYYYRTYPNDKKVYRWAVLLLFLLGFFHTVASCVTMYSMTVLNFDNAAALNQISWGFIADPVSTGIIALIVEIFYAYRVFVVSGRKAIVIPIFILLLAALQLTVAVYATIWASFHPFFSEIPKIRWAVGLWLFSMAAGDVVITLGLYFYLHKQKGGREDTDTVLARVIKNTVSNNLATGVASVGSSLLYIAGPGAWHVLFGLVISKLYQMSLLASLNVRKELARDLNGGLQSFAFSAKNGPTTMKEGAVVSQIPTAKSISDRFKLSSRANQNGSIDSSGTDSLTGSSTRHGDKSDLGVGIMGNTAGAKLGHVYMCRGASGGVSAGSATNSAHLPIQVTVEETKSDFLQEPQASWDHSQSKLNSYVPTSYISPLQVSPGLSFTQGRLETAVSTEDESSNPREGLERDLEKGSP